MMWNASVNAICDRAHGTGFTASTQVSTLVTSAGPYSSSDPVRQLRAGASAGASRARACSAAATVA